MKDTKFIVSLLLLFILNIGAAYILNFVSFFENKKEIVSHTDNKTDIFFKKLAVIDKGFDYVDFIKKINPKKVAKVEKKSFKQQVLKKDSKKVVKKIKNVDIYTKLETKFKKSKDFKVALKLSRLYYTSKKYKKSLKWAKIANELNQKDDGSWILFAKTKIKMGQKDIAKKALITYSKAYDSKKVKELLHRISS